MLIIVLDGVLVIEVHLYFGCADWFHEEFILFLLFHHEYQVISK
jgi:hypothetical protein